MRKVKVDIVGLADKIRNDDDLRVEWEDSLRTALFEENEIERYIQLQFPKRSASEAGVVEIHIISDDIDFNPGLITQLLSIRIKIICRERSIATPLQIKEIAY